MPALARPPRALAVAAALAATLASAACDSPERATPIGTLLRETARFDGQQVTVRGRVTGSLKLPFVSQRAFGLADSTGEITVLTYGAPPRSGEVTTVRGRFTTVATVGAASFGAHLVVGTPPAAER